MNDFIKSASVLQSLSNDPKTKRANAVGRNRVPKTSTKINQPEQSFGEVLRKVKFSKHAASRLSTRDISLSSKEMARIEKGIGLAKQKGIKQTLIMMDDKVFVASAKNDTIITAVSGDKLKENVFTNIDGAVIV